MPRIPAPEEKAGPVKLPNAEQSIVESRKITHYLLSETHPDGKSKENFFSRFGFHPARWETLAAALRQHCWQHEVLETKTTAWGVQYVIVGALQTPDGRDPAVRSVWQIDHGADLPRFISGRPAR